MSDYRNSVGEKGADMADELRLDAYAEAESMYGEYVRLAELGDLAQLGLKTDDSSTEIIASVAPSLIESGRNALLV